jgi:hypothetical protein
MRLDDVRRMGKLSLFFKKKKGQVSTPLCTVAFRLYSGFGGVNSADLVTKQLWT